MSVATANGSAPRHQNQRMSFWLLAFGFWLLAFGFWLLAFKKGTYPFAMAAPTHLSALTAGYFGLGVETGHMVDTCTETWLTHYGP